MKINPTLAWYLAWRRLRHQRKVAAATVLGVTIGMLVIGTILIVDENSSVQPVAGAPLTRFPERLATTPNSTADGTTPPAHPAIVQVYFERGPIERAPTALPLPSQKGETRAGLSGSSPPTRRGEKDYQAMRLAVRLAALLAFAVGAVIVFYTMRFSVAASSREFSLLRCLGESRGNLTLSLLLETLLLGTTGTLFGLLLAFPVAGMLLSAGISTTGRVPTNLFTVPWPELAAVGGLSILTALLGVLSPALTLYRMLPATVLQPRTLTGEPDPQHIFRLRGFSWLIPPLAAMAWLALRPFVKSWLSVVQFFLFESLFVIALALAALWWMQPLLRAAIGLTEAGLNPLLPLDALLVTRRMRLASQKLAVTLAGVTLVFSLLTALHDITLALKQEIHLWAQEALYPYVYFERNRKGAGQEERLRQLLKSRKLALIRLSEKAQGEFPVRLIAAADVNPLRAADNRPLLTPESVIVSRTLAARFGVHRGDRLVIDTGREIHRFTLIDITDRDGFFAEEGQYVDLKSYLLFSDGNPLFQGALEQSLGRYAMVRKTDGSAVTEADIQALAPFYRFKRSGALMGQWQRAEIDRDFLIFDFVLSMTVILAAVGVTNSILIQVHARRREFAVLRTLGISRGQTVRLLLVEGAVIGGVGAALALLLGNTIGAISVAFLDRFTLFEYRFVFSYRASIAITLLTLLTCTLAAIYPALAANRISSAESLHYE